MKIICSVMIFFLGLCVASCQSGQDKIPLSPEGKKFPSVKAQSLNGESLEIPDDYSGRPVLLLIGYVQQAQFDADRWLYGAISSGLQHKAEVLEIPTIEGLIPGLMSGWIDRGMRSGIPEEDWPSVACVYSDAEKIIQFTGNDHPRNIRAVLLDEKGHVLHMHDRGFSAGVLHKMHQLLDSR